MPPQVGKSKPKGREGRQSRSRNTTPNSLVESSIPSAIPTVTSFTDMKISALMVPSNISYDDILERHGGAGAIPDPSHLNTIAKNLKELSDLAAARSDACHLGIRILAEKRKAAFAEERERELEEENAARMREAEEIVKKEAEDEDEVRGRRGGKPKKKKESSSVLEERPLNTGAHGLARQDGLDLPLEAFPSQAARTAPLSPGKRKRETMSGSSSSLSEASPLASPIATVPPMDQDSAHATQSASSPDDDARQPLPAASIAQYQTFGPNPLTFDDPTIYEVRPVTDDMTDEEKKEIYCVASFPHDDLHDLIAGTPPNKDFSNAVKPSNQVAAHTFQTYLDNYLRPLREEDIGFLNERVGIASSGYWGPSSQTQGDRAAPFLIPPRGKRHYTEIWAEEDGMLSRDTPEQDRLPSNLARGSLEDMDDDVAETDQISNGPILSRLLQTMRPEHRSFASETQANGLANGTGESSVTNGDLPNGASHEVPANDEAPNKPAVLPSATALPASDRQPNNAPTMTHAQIDERVKMELRHLGLFPPDEEPNFDAHYDDEVSERLRYLQEELKRVSILNGARKQRVLELAEEQLAYQEYATIHEDLDGQVQQAFLKRNRTLGKSKKNTKRPGGAGGGSHPVHGGVSTDGGISKPGIGDAARMLMTRRANWESSIAPVFRSDIRRVRGKGEGIFGEAEMEPYIRAEKERWEEDENAF